MDFSDGGVQQVVAQSLQVAEPSPAPAPMDGCHVLPAPGPSLGSPGEGSVCPMGQAELSLGPAVDVPEAGAGPNPEAAVDVEQGAQENAHPLGKVESTDPPSPPPPHAGLRRTGCGKH